MILTTSESGNSYLSDAWKLCGEPESEIIFWELFLRLRPQFKVTRLCGPVWINVDGSETYLTSSGLAIDINKEGSIETLLAFKEGISNCVHAT